MPFTGSSDFLEVRGTTFTAEALTGAVEDVVPDYPWQHITFSSYVPRSPAAGARWRATVDLLSEGFPGEDAPLARSARLPAAGPHAAPHLPQQRARPHGRRSRGRLQRRHPVDRPQRAPRFIEEHAHEDLSVG